jgi:hypothetical protein
MKYALSNIYSIALFGLSILTIPVFVISTLLWLDIRFGSGGVRPISDLGIVCVILLILIAALAVASVIVGAVFYPAEAQKRVDVSAAP